MKYIFTFLFALFLINGVKAQDLIVTNKQDSIKCKIIEVNTDLIKYTKRNVVNARITTINLDEVENYVKGFYKDDEIKTGTKSDNSSKSKGNSKENVLSNEVKLANGMNFSVDIGYGYRYQDFGNDYITYNDETHENYKSDLRGGLLIGALFNFTQENVGSALFYNYFSQSNEYYSDENNGFFDNAENLELRNNIQMHYFGLGYLTRYFLSSDKLFLNIGISGGYFMHNNEETYKNKKHTYESSGVAITLDASLNYLFYQNMSLGLKANYFKAIDFAAEFEDSESSIDRYQGILGLSVIYQIHF